MALEDLKPAPLLPPPDHETVVNRQRTFGYTQEDLKILLAPMALNGEEAIGSMGTDTALAVLSDRPRLLYDYFQQLFAQVTNPPLDAIREELVTSMGSTIGPEGNLLKPVAGVVPPDQDRVGDSGQRRSWRSCATSTSAGSGRFRFRCCSTRESGGRGLARALEDLQKRTSEAVAEGYTIIILSDRGVNFKLAPIPSLLAVASIHHHLVREGTRNRAAFVIESGDAREVHHLALLIGYGAGAVNPYLAFETLDDMIRHGMLPGVTHEKAVKNYIKALNKGVLKVMSKMGISTLQSYRGAQIFEAIGLDKDFVDRYFTHTASRIGGVGIDAIAEEVRARHEQAFPQRPVAEPRSGRGRRIPVAPRRRVPSLQPGHRLQAAARDAKRAVQDLQGIHAGGERSDEEARDAARPVRAEARRPRPFRSTRSSRWRAS